VSEPPEEPEEPHEGEPGSDDESTGSDDADAALRGWIDPDDRLWRHPSEVATPSAGGPTAPLLIKPPARHPWRNAAMILVGAVALMAAVAWLVILLSPASDHPLTATTRDTAAVPISTLPGAQNAVPAAAAATGHSIVELRAVTAHGTATLIGVAVAEGGMVATTADVLSGLRRLDLVGPGGQLEQASVVGTDSASDIALVNVPENVPVAPFSDDVGVTGGTPDLTLTLVPAGGALVLHCTPGSVTSVGTAIPSGPADGMPAIESSSSSAAAGSPLLNSAGDVLGILYQPVPGSSSGLMFLPTVLVVGVADDLRSGDKVVHGWLGVSGTDAGNGTGAKVASVDPDGPAAGHLLAGQVIVALDAQPVRTMAELRARLYVLAPGTPVAVSVQGASGVKVVDLTLGSSS
jgi:S1-C subfamily serine protease